MATKKYELKSTDGWIKIADGSGTVIIEIKNGGVYMAISDTQPEPFTEDHHSLPNWSTLTSDVTGAWIRTYSNEADVIISVIPTLA